MEPQNVIHVYIFIKEAISVGVGGGGSTVEEHTYISWWIYRYILYEPLMICFIFFIILYIRTKDNEESIDPQNIRSYPT
jgi:hypothetical protein